MLTWPFRTAAVAVAIIGVFSHQDIHLIRLAGTEWHKLANQINKRESETERKQRELLFLKAAYDRLQADLDEDPNRSGAQSLLTEQDVILQMMRERGLPTAAMVSRTPANVTDFANVTDQAKARQVQVTSRPTDAATEGDSRAEQPIAIAPIPPRAAPEPTPRTDTD
jgi:hypothetical protein